MKEKVLAAVLSATLMSCIAMTGCSGGSSSDEKVPTDSAATAASNTSQAAPASSTAQATPKYAVTIDDCQVTTDYAGKPAIVVTYTWANNSDKATSFMVAVSAKTFQNGVQLDTGVVSDIDAQSSMNEIKPGATATVQQAYVLDDQSDVTVECTELIGLDDTVIAEKTFSVA